MTLADFTLTDRIRNYRNILLKVLPKHLFIFWHVNENVFHFSLRGRSMFAPRCFTNLRVIYFRNAIPQRSYFTGSIACTIAFQATPKTLHAIRLVTNHVAHKCRPKISVCVPGWTSKTRVQDLVAAENTIHLSDCSERDKLLTAITNICNHHLDVSFTWDQFINVFSSKGVWYCKLTSPFIFFNAIIFILKKAELHPNNLRNKLMPMKVIFHSMFSRCNIILLRQRFLR